MARLTRSSVPCLHVFDWLRFEHPAGHPADPKAHGKSVTAPLTGQDSRALQAFIHAVELYCVSDEHGRHCAIKAMRALVDAAQPKTHLLFKEAIACAYDWEMRDDLWEQMGLDEQSLREELCAGCGEPQGAGHTHGGLCRQCYARKMPISGGGQSDDDDYDPRS